MQEKENLFLKVAYNHIFVVFHKLNCQLPVDIPSSCELVTYAKKMVLAYKLEYLDVPGYQIERICYKTEKKTRYTQLYDYLCKSDRCERNVVRKINE